MKYYSRTNTYKASNVTFDYNTFEAVSYSWWTFFKVINGKKVFNSYSYSPTTIKHQYKLRALLRELDITIDMDVQCPAGLQDSYSVQSASEYYSNEISKLKEAISRPRSQARKNKEREIEIEKLAEICVKFKLLVEEN